jgi:DNA mismatch endonuclease Vsr
LASHLEGSEPPHPLIVGPAHFRGVAVPGGLAAAKELRSAGKHDDAARRVLTGYLGKLDASVISQYAVDGTGVEADIALPRRKIAVLVNGCFIYGCAQHSRGTKSQDVWWRKDIDRRVAARVGQVEELRRAGWAVHVVWEHEDPAVASERVLSREAAA